NVANTRQKGTQLVWPKELRPLRPIFVLFVSQLKSLFSRRVHRPEPNQCLRSPAAARQCLAIRRERDRFEPVLRTGQRLQKRAGTCVPKLDGRILAAAGEGCSVRRKGHG